MTSPHTSLWEGRPLTDLTKEELIVAVEWLGAGLIRQRKQTTHEIDTLFAVRRNAMTSG